jgi:glycosyltransferase involved in cell wall biosynthesis
MANNRNAAQIKKIAFHFPRLVQGGAEVMRLTLSKELISRGYEVDLVVFNTTGELADRVPEGVNIVSLNVDRTLKSLFPLCRYLNSKQRPDVLISSLGHQNAMTVLASMLSRGHSRIFITQHNALSEEAKRSPKLKDKIVPLLYRLLARRAGGIFAVSKGVANDMADTCKIDRERISVLYNPAYPSDVQRMIEEPIDLVSEAGTKDVIFAGRLVYQKGVDILLEAFSKVLTTIGARLIICGDGPDASKLKSQAAQLGISDRVIFLGYQPNPLKFIARSDLFVLPSRFEGFGNVLVEALACGTPIVSSNCFYGPSEILENGKYGRLVEVNNPDALAIGIVASLTAIHDREQLKTRAKEFTVSSVTDRYLSALSKA